MTSKLWSFALAIYIATCGALYLVGAVALFVPPALAQAPDVPAASGFDIEAIVVGLIVPYVATALGVSSTVGVLRWLARWLGYIPGLRWVPALLVKPEGAEKFTPAQVDALRGLVLALSAVAAWRGAVMPLGGEAAGTFGLVGATCLVALLAMTVADVLTGALRRAPAAE